MGECIDFEDARFDQWIKKVDHILLSTCGLTSDYLPDCLYRDWFDDNMDYQKAAKIAAAFAQEYISGLTH